MKNVKMLLFACAVLFGCNPPDKVTTGPTGPDEKVLSASKDASGMFVLTKAQNDMVVAERDKLIAQRADSVKRGTNRSFCPGPFPTVPIALSVYGNYYRSSGNDAIVSYPTTITNEGQYIPFFRGWQSNNQFMVPCDGLYYISWAFEKDSYYYGGTNDDVWVYVVKLPASGGSGIRYGMAWSGEPQTRGTGADHIILRLNEGDDIFTMVHSDGNGLRHLIYSSFTIHRIGN